MKEVADEARGKEDIYKQLVMRVTTSLVLEFTNLFAFCPNGIKRSLLRALSFNYMYFIQRSFSFNASYLQVQ